MADGAAGDGPLDGLRWNKSKHSPVAANAHKVGFHLNGVIHGQSEKIQSKKNQSKKIKDEKGQEIRETRRCCFARQSEKNKGEKEHSAEAEKGRRRQAESQGRQENRQQSCAQEEGWTQEGRRANSIRADAGRIELEICAC